MSGEHVCMEWGECWYWCLRCGFVKGMQAEECLSKRETPPTMAKHGQHWDDLGHPVAESL